MIKKQSIEIGDIPSVLFGPETDKLFIAVHGDQSDKNDTVITIFAEEAAQKGYQVLSFDLPEHGDRQNESRQCDPKNCTEDLSKIMAYACEISDDISLFGCSIGAYFDMLAYQDKPIKQSLFFSPVVDMKRIIHNMMAWFDVSEEQLKRKKQSRLQQKPCIGTIIKKY